ncbi:AcrR family transcriptional regulator [Sphingomonas sp. UYAg733]
MTERRPYTSAARDAVAAATRTRLLAAAGAVLREGETLSLEGVAKRAGVTRLTVYNQFGSRRGLLEALFDERAAAGGLDGLAGAMAMADPRAALREAVAIFTHFWGGDGAVARLHDAAAADPEFGTALAERHERRHKLIGILLERMAITGEPGSELTDVLTALTSQAFHAQLAKGRDAMAIRRIVTQLVDAAIDARPA